jgi:hypothetical protein
VTNNKLFEITEANVAELAATSNRFTDLANRLLRQECANIGVRPDYLLTSLRDTVPDGGVDSRVIDAPVGSTYVPSGLSVWQNKSGTDHQPNHIRKEFAKPGVQEALRNGATTLFL